MRTRTTRNHYIEEGDGLLICEHPAKNGRRATVTLMAGDDDFVHLNVTTAQLPVLRDLVAALERFAAEEAQANAA